MKTTPALLALALLVLNPLAVWRAAATDYADSSELLQRNREQNQAQHGTGIEVDGMIESVKPGNPSWYSIYLELDNGNQVTLIVYPKTKFYLHYQPMDAASAYKLFAHGQKIRILHNTFLDTYLKHEMITDLMFVDK